MLSRNRMLGLLCLDNQKRPICLGLAEHAPRHSESFPGQPCKERGEVEEHHYRRVSRQPAASASSTEQNQRVPFEIFISIFAYQRLVGW